MRVGCPVPELEYEMDSVTRSTLFSEAVNGVLATFQTRTSPLASSTRQMSVNVPPESTPTRHMRPCILAEPGEGVNVASVGVQCLESWASGCA